MSTLSIEAPMAPRGVVAKAGAFAAGTALAGAALLGGTAVAPTITAGLSASVQHDVALTAIPTALPVGSFAEALQNALAGMHMGTVGELLGLLGQNADGTAPLYDVDTPLYVAAVTDADGNVTTPASGLLVDLLSINGAPITLGGLTDILGVSLTDPIWSSDAATDSVLGTGSILTMPDAAGDATPIGNLSIDQLLSDMLGGDVTSKTVGDLFNGMGMGGLVGFVTLLCDPGAAICTPDLLGGGIGTLDADSTVASLVQSLLGVNTDTTLGAYLTGLDPDLTSGSIGSLLGLPTGDTLAQLLAGMTLGGSVLGGPGIELGSLDLGQLIGSLTDDPTNVVSDGTIIGGLMEAMGLFG
jgi:hypothetical protein